MMSPYRLVALTQLPQDLFRPHPGPAGRQAGGGRRSAAFSDANWAQNQGARTFPDTRPASTGHRSRQRSVGRIPVRRIGQAGGGRRPAAVSDANWAQNQGARTFPDPRPASTGNRSRQRSVGRIPVRRDGQDRPAEGAESDSMCGCRGAGGLALPDLDEPLWNGISVRHALSHTTGLPNWRPAGGELRPIRPPGQQWGYSGEGFLFLQHTIERQTGQPITEVARERVFLPLGMRDSRLDGPVEGRHGLRPLITTAQDYGLFVAYVLGLDDERWQVQCQIDEQLAWGAGWGLELGVLRFGWQWGLDADASHFVIGCPSTGDGVAVFTDSAGDGREFYRRVLAKELPGHHPSLVVENNATFLRLVQEQEQDGLASQTLVPSRGESGAPPRIMPASSGQAAATTALCPGVPSNRDGPGRR